MPALEKNLERRLAAAVTAAGGFSIKLAPTVTGLPDRLLVHADSAHTIHFVELKRAGQRPRPAQRYIHKRLADLGHPVIVLAGAQEVDAYIAAWCSTHTSS